MSSGMKSGWNLSVQTTARRAPDTEEAADRQQKQLFMRRCGPGEKSSSPGCATRLAWEQLKDSAPGLMTGRCCEVPLWEWWLTGLQIMFTQSLSLVPSTPCSLFMWLLCPIQTEKSELMWVWVTRRFSVLGFARFPQAWVQTVQGLIELLHLSLEANNLRDQYEWNRIKRPTNTKIQPWQEATSPNEPSCWCLWGFWFRFLCSFVQVLSLPLRLDLAEIQRCFVFVTSSTLTPDIQSKNKKPSRAASHACSCHSNGDGSWPARTNHTGMDLAQVRN